MTQTHLTPSTVLYNKNQSVCIALLTLPPLHNREEDRYRGVRNDTEHVLQCRVVF